MWGTRPANGSIGSSFRFIPTHVGNTRHKERFGGLGGVHPHACGEHFFDYELFRNCYGSSPRMWGTQPLRDIEREINRFIPTHVGNTSLRPKRVSILPVHPHACGEHYNPLASDWPSCGSSPRMWGTRIDLHEPDTISRFIPTHVGNTFSLHQFGENYTVHPHACGEHKKG